MFSKNENYLKTWLFSYIFLWVREGEALENVIFSLLRGSIFASGRGTIGFEGSAYGHPPPSPPPAHVCSSCDKMQRYAVAIARLSRPVELSERVLPVCLPQPQGGEGVDMHVGKLLSLTAW